MGGRGGGGGGTVRSGASGDDDSGPVGPFPSWGALYGTVVAWALTLIVLLYLFTVFLNVGTATP